MTDVDFDTYTKLGLFTKNYYRDVYPAIEPTQPRLSQAGKVTMVTGGGRGLGKSIAIAQAQAGAKVILVGRSESQLERARLDILKEIPEADIFVASADISREESVDALFAKAATFSSVIDTLVNNAGVFSTSFDLIGKVSLDSWWGDFEVNLKGTFLMTSRFLRLYGTSKNATIINVATNSSIVGPQISSYFLSKLSLVRFGEFVAVEYPDVMTYSIDPGNSPTDMTLESFRPFAKDTPELVAGSVAYLAAMRPTYLNGRYISATWDIGEIEKRKNEITESDLLKLSVRI